MLVLLNHEHNHSQEERALVVISGQVALYLRYWELVCLVGRRNALIVRLIVVGLLTTDG